MKILELIKVLLKLLGLIPVEKMPSILEKYKLKLNFAHICLMFILQLFLFTSSWWFFIVKAHTFIEYTDSGYFASISVLTVSLYLVFVLKISKLIGIMRRLEEIIVERKFSIIKREIYL